MQRVEHVEIAIVACETIMNEIACITRAVLEDARVRAPRQARVSTSAAARASASMSVSASVETFASVTMSASVSVAHAFLEHDLHRTPWRLRDRIQEQVGRAAERGADAIVLGYGLCSGGLVGVRAPGCPVVVPRVHDCISLLLGSAEAYEREFRRAPGTYYLTPGWIEFGGDPLTLYRELLAKHDPPTARWLATEPLKGYTRVAYIDTATTAGEGTVEATRAAMGTARGGAGSGAGSGAGVVGRDYRAHAREVAAFIGAEYEEMVGSLDLLRRLVECGLAVGRRGRSGEDEPRRGDPGRGLDVAGIAVIRPGEELDAQKVLPSSGASRPGSGSSTWVDARAAWEGGSGD